jgi:hypothetical protein
MLYLLFIFIFFMVIFAACSFGVLYYRANLIATDAEKRLETSQEESKKYKEQYLNLKNRPEIIIDKVKKLKSILKAIENRIHGYGEEYLIPIESVIDDLGTEFAYSQPGKELKNNNKKIKAMIKNEEAAKSWLDDVTLRTNATDFILDAFLGKAESLMSKVKSDNYGKLKQQLIDVFSLVNVNGLAFKTSITNQFLDAYLEKLKWASILQKMKKEQQEEQKALREKIREEEKVRREAEKVKKEAEREEEIVQKALAVAYEKMSKASEEEKLKYEQQISDLQKNLAEAAEKGKRAISMAQQTKSGNVYVISNIGSFGENVFKIGMTRRLNPQDRVDELGDSSVPFEFDVHAFIRSDDAPGLEKKLHKLFVHKQMNKMNHRKEFFKVKLNEIRQEIENLGLESTWSMQAASTQYLETISLEKKMERDPNLREKWANRQLELDELDLGKEDVGEDLDEDEPVKN